KASMKGTLPKWLASAQQIAVARSRHGWSISSNTGLPVLIKLLADGDSDVVPADIVSLYSHCRPTILIYLRAPLNPRNQIELDYAAGSKSWQQLQELVSALESENQTVCCKMFQLDFTRQDTLKNTAHDIALYLQELQGAH
ncbi:MAG: hypothetical protein ACR2PS_07320, partial [Pseudomonadales bacterium]